MKINPADIKMGYKLLALDAEDDKWYKAEVIDVEEYVITLRDIDIKSEWEGMIWITNMDDIQNITLYKTLK